MSLPKNTYPHLDLPIGQEVIAFRAIERVLKNDPIFGTATKTWITWDGSINDTSEPAYSWCPFCQLGPFPSESHWITENQHEAPMVCRIQLATGGTNFDEIGNYWAAMRAAIFPQDPAQRELVLSQLQAVTINRTTITLMGYAWRTDAATAAQMMIADGTISFHLLINT